jgi:hypothetical protein
MEGEHLKEEDWNGWQLLNMRTGNYENGKTTNYTTL